MGRQKKQGLSWFPLVVNFFADKRIRRLISRFGAEGALLYIYILCAAYEHGYYLPYSPDFLDDAALDIGCESKRIKPMLDYILDKGLLSRELFDKAQVLTSHGIQSQFQESMKLLRRKTPVKAQLWLLTGEETLPDFVPEDFQIKADKSRENENKSGIYKDKPGINATKEIKEKKTKENKRKGGEAVPIQSPVSTPPELASGLSPSSSPPSLEEIVNYCAGRKSGIDPVRFYDYYSSRSWLSGGKPVSDWHSLISRWELTERPGKQHLVSALEYRAKPEKSIDLALLKKQVEKCKC